MVWYIVFRDRKLGVYESWADCSDCVVGFGGAAFQSYSTRMQAKEGYQAFLEHITEKGEHVSNKWSLKDWVALVQFVVITILWYEIMSLVCLWL
jgi:viroplasmin and RNaseH domain-containing protein